MHLLFDAAVVPDPNPELFSPRALEDEGLISGTAAGRGTAYFITRATREWVLRHYRRGGLPGRIFKDTYLGLTPEDSRAWREWRLLADLHHRGLPVPRPVAARTEMHPGCYRCDLITERILGVRSLADRFRQGTLSAVDWRAVGSCIRRFHDAGVYHADLNAQNILLDDHSRVYLIDFDRCEIRSSRWWKRSNLKRLFRSLKKLKASHRECHFSEIEEGWFSQGYND